MVSWASRGPLASIGAQGECADRAFGYGGFMPSAQDGRFAMTVSLTKGGNVSLTKEAGPAGLSAVIVGLGWDTRTTTGTDFDLDASALLVKTDGKVLSDQHFVFYGNLKSPEGAVEHTGDNVTGEGEGDDEQIKVNLVTVPAEADKIVFPVSVYDADTRQQNFGQVRNAFIRVVNAADNAELARYDLSEDASTETAMIFGELYRSGAEWKFRAVGQGYAAGLKGIASDFGVSV
jgi:tellurium resistance protein TerD